MAQAPGTPKPGDDAADTVAAATARAEVRPTIYKVKKKRYSGRLEEPQRLEPGVSRAAQRLAQAAADGMAETRARNKKSARKKRDGVIKDAVRNAGRGLAAALDTAAKMPADLTGRLSTKRLARLVVPPPFTGFLK